jgi:hypothetical protein
MNRWKVISNVLFTVLLISPALFTPIVKADEWDLRKADSSFERVPLQKWCKVGGKDERFANTAVLGYEPCGELNTKVVCDAVGKKLISKGPVPKGFRDCSEGPRIIVERIGPPIPTIEEAKAQLEPEGVLQSPSDQIASGLKSYQNYIDSLDDTLDEKPKAKRRQDKHKSNGGSEGLNSLAGQLSPQMLTQALKLLGNLD